MKNRLDVKVSLFQNCKASGMPVSEISLCDFLSGSTFRGKYKTTVDRYRAAGDEDKNRLKNESPCRYGKRNIQQAEQCGVDRPQRSDLH